MTVDLTPVVQGAVSLAVVALTTVGTWAIKRLATKLGVQANSAAMNQLDDMLTRAIQSGAATAETTIAAKGWDHPDVKNAILTNALSYALDRGGPALKAAGLDPSNTTGVSLYLTNELSRLFPTAVAPVVASPVTPPAPGDVPAPAPATPLRVGAALGVPGMPAPHEGSHE